MEFLGIWLLFCVLCGALARNKGRSFFGYALLAVILSPIISAIILVCLPNSSATNKIKNGIEKKCPACAETVKTEAKICKHCGHTFAELVEQVVQDTSHTQKSSTSTTNSRKSSNIAGVGVVCALLAVVALVFVANNKTKIDNPVDPSTNNIPPVVFTKARTDYIQTLVDQAQYERAYDELKPYLADNPSATELFNIFKQEYVNSIEQKLKTIPSRFVEDNLKYYTILSSIDSTNQRYQTKREFYQSFVDKNIGNKLIINADNHIRYRAFRETIEVSGNKCPYVAEAHYMGVLDLNDGDAYWKVVCTYESYIVRILPDEEGTSRVLNCSLAESVIGASCDVD